MAISLYLGLFGRYSTGTRATWSATIRHASTNYTGKLVKESGYHMLSHYKQNVTIKVFERLATSLKYTHMSKREYLSLKMDLFEDYSYPKPFPTDKFQRLKHESPNQSYVILGQKGTGKSCKRRKTN